MNHGHVYNLTQEFYAIEAPKNSEISLKASRPYLYLQIHYKNLYFLIPLHSKLKTSEFASYPLPSTHKPLAGLNFEKVVVLTSEKYIDKRNHLPSSQSRELNNNLSKINNKFITYIQTFIKACHQGNEKSNYNYKFSTLHGYKHLLID